MSDKKPDTIPAPSILGGRFDPRRMIRDQTFAGSGGTHEGLLKVSLGKPHSAHFFRSHPDFHYGPINILPVKTNLGKIAKRGDFFFCEADDVAAELSRFVRKCTLHLTITVQRALSIWPIPCPDDDGNWFEAHAQATEIVKIAEQDWIQVSWDDQRGYVPNFPDEPITCKPNWYTEVPDERIMEIAFDRCTITDMEHPVAKYLKGRGITDG